MNKKQIIILSLIAVIAIISTTLALTSTFGDKQTTNLFQKHTIKKETQDLQLETNEEDNERFAESKNPELKGHSSYEESSYDYEDDEEQVWSKEERRQMVEERDTEFTHTCIHDQIIEDSKQMYEDLEKEAEVNPKIENHESTQWEPIRFHVDYQNIENRRLPRKDIDFIKNKLIPAAQAYFQTTFRVKRLSDPIIPNDYYRRSACGNTKMYNSLFNGVSNADMVMVIDSEYNGSSGVLAYAGQCPQGSREISSQRPTLGRFVVNAAYLERDLNAKRWFKWIETSIHEMMHAMGFAGNQFKKFQSGRVTTRNGQNYFLGQNTVAYAQKYFNCNSANGVPIEQNGGSGSAGSHWERIALGNEGMTASAWRDAVYSEFTLNLFKDSGWYDFNQDNAQELVWGKGAGCKTMYGTCDTRATMHSCQGGCTFDHGAVGTCSQSDPFEPGCQYVQGYSNEICDIPDNQARVFQALGGEQGEDSRCWNISSQKSGYGGIRAGCFNSKCVDGQVSVQLDNNWQTCQYKGQKLQGSISTVICPEPDAFCLVEANCPNSCTAQGTCRNGKCQCYEGYSGNSCQNKKGQTTSNRDGKANKPKNTSRSYGKSEYCAPQERLTKQYGKYKCCSYRACCPLYATYRSNGYCYCIPGKSYNSYNRSCE